MFCIKIDESGEAHVTVTCKKCKSSISIPLKLEDVEKYREGALIQDAFPYLDENQRELLMSGICGTCFDKMFSE